MKPNGQPLFSQFFSRPFQYSSSSYCWHHIQKQIWRTTSNHLVVEVALNGIRFEVSSVRGVVATDHPTCSQFGVDILNKGGNAVDAAVSAKLCLGVLSPASSGIGGGAFILIHNSSTGLNTFIDSRETAPTFSDSHMFVDDPLAAQNGGLAIAVPAELIGLYTVWLQGGSLPWSDLVLPSSILAEEWVISLELAAYIQSSSQYLYDGKYPELSALYLDPKTGLPKVAGDIVNQPVLASFLRSYAEKGPDIFYRDAADTIAKEIQDAGGIMIGDDIRGYTPIIYTDSELIKSSFNGYEYIGVGGSSSGGAAVAGILNFMESYPEPLVSIGQVYYQRLAEAFKHVFAIRLSLGDPEFVDTTAPIAALLDKEYMTNLQLASSDDDVLPLSEYGGMYNLTRSLPDDQGTTHLSVIDAWGHAVAMTSTVNTYFGSKVISPSTGILFNNEMDDFSVPGTSNFFELASSPLNYPQPYKRPLSSMSPSFVFDKKGRLRLIGGASGGPHIITATVQIILDYISRGMSLLDAVTSPRMHSQLLPNILYVENSPVLLSPVLDGDSIVMGEDTVSALLSRHQPVNSTNSVGITQFIAIDPDTGVRSGVSDPRKGGQPSAQ